MRKIKSYIRSWTKIIKSLFKKKTMYKDVNSNLNNLTSEIISTFIRFANSPTIFNNPNLYYGYLVFPSNDQFFLGEKRFSITFSNYPIFGISSLQLFYIKNIIEKDVIKITLPIGVESSGIVTFEGKFVENDANFPNLFFDYLEEYLQKNNL